MARGIDFSDVAWNEDGTLVWREARSERGVLVVQPPGEQAIRDLNADYSVRAGVGYGGGDFTVGRGSVFFVEAESGRLYRQTLQGGRARAITPAYGSAAAPTVSPDGQALLYVHSYENQDVISVVDCAGEHWPQKLVSGDDFYMQPCWHPDGERLAWIAWNHPNMPWDGTTLNIANVVRHSNGNVLPTLGEVSTVAGDEDTAIFQPEFSPDGRYLAFVSDESGWWQIYLYDIESGEYHQLTSGAAEHGNPAWVQGMRTYGFDPQGDRLYFIRNQDGFKSLWSLDLATGGQTQLSVSAKYTWMEQISVAPVGGQVALLASGGRIPKRVLDYDLEEGTRLLRRSSPEDLPPEAYAPPQAITWKGIDSGEVHGLYYAPNNQAFEGIGLPPLVVLIHGGPTSQRGAHFDPGVQFFTSRGYAVLQVNYRGSTGYGRAYRDALKGNWGVYDVQDAVSGARHLARQGMVEEGKMVIMGGSAGGFTVLKALEDYPGTFRAGVCLYGVANQFNLAAETHKFEEHYLDSMLGPLPEAADLYRERSPINFADQIQDPVAIFQGEDDKLVPKSQSDEIVAALEKNGIPHEYHLYEGEGHGFRKSETVEAFYTAVEKFLQRYVIYA
jgi:dipeptidyl aminopeptidase/acylaminoacyl peptidase